LLPNNIAQPQFFLYRKRHRNRCRVPVLCTNNIAQPHFFFGDIAASCLCTTHMPNCPWCVYFDQGGSQISISTDFCVHVDMSFSCLDIACEIAFFRNFIALFMFAPLRSYPLHRIHCIVSTSYTSQVTLQVL
jgi:hypothetical protein